ncbi:hypothetical protein ACJX0J_016463, partial [Zea mays]
NTIFQYTYFTYRYLDNHYILNFSFLTLGRKRYILLHNWATWQKASQLTSCFVVLEVEFSNYISDCNICWISLTIHLYTSTSSLVDTIHLYTSTSSLVDVEEGRQFTYTLQYSQRSGMHSPFRRCTDY